MSSHKKRKALHKKRRRQRRYDEAPGTSFLPPKTLIIKDPPGMAKMSVVLEEFVEEEMQSAESVDDLRKLLSVATIAWNAALLPPAKREQFIKDSEAKLPAEARMAFRSTLELLIQRKLDYFADNQRRILSFDLSMRSDGPFLNVMSTMPGE